MHRSGGVIDVGENSQVDGPSGGDCERSAVLGRSAVGHRFHIRVIIAR